MKRHNVLVRGGTVVSPVSVVALDIRSQDGTIVDVGPNLRREESDEVIDVGGLHVLPGVIDAHSHQWEEGLASREDFRDDTASAVAGGITTIIDHPLTTPVVTTRSGFRAKVKLGQATSFSDFALHAAVGRNDLTHLESLWQEGATGFKLFTCDSGTSLEPFRTPAELRRVLTALAHLDAVALVHAEDQQMLDDGRRALVESGRRDVRYFGEWRSVRAEAIAIRRVLAAAEATGCFVYLVHTSIPEGVNAANRARLRGVRIEVETCPHYLYFTDQDIADVGHKATTSPPARDARRRASLRRLLSDSIAVVGSDNGAVTLARKTTRDVFNGQPGIPGNELMLSLMLNLVAGGVLSVERLVMLVCEAPAKIFGIFDRKGSIAPGKDADLTFVDLGQRHTVRAELLIGSAGWSPYDGLRLQGRVQRTMIRGRTVALEGKPVGHPGSGRFIPRGLAPQMASFRSHASV